MSVAKAKEKILNAHGVVCGQNKLACWRRNQVDIRLFLWDKREIPSEY